MSQRLLRLPVLTRNGVLYFRFRLTEMNGKHGEKLYRLLGVSGVTDEPAVRVKRAKILRLNPLRLKKAV